MNLPGRFAGIAQAVGNKVGAPYYSGVLIIDGTPGGYDDDGVFQPGGVPTEIPCKVQIDALSQGLRVAAGYADTEYAFVILAAGLTVDIDTDAKVRVDDAKAPADFRGTWLVSSLLRDPAGIAYSGRGRLA